jgi:hypothetical protein
MADRTDDGRWTIKPLPSSFFTGVAKGTVQGERMLPLNSFLEQTLIEQNAVKHHVKTKPHDGILPSPRPLLLTK